MKYVLCVIMFASLSFALIPWSFRYQSTANLWEDDYDLLFDPARITEINGSRVYTSLSNFVTGSEELFSNGSVPFVLVGGSTYFMSFYPGLVYDRTAMKNGLNTGLEANGMPIFGEGTVSEVTWYDDDNNGSYDRRAIETENRIAYNKEDEADYYLGFGARLDGIRYGLGFMRSEDKNTYTDPVNNFNFDYTEENLPTASLTLIERASSAGDNITTSVGNDFILSVWYDQPNWNLGLKTGYGMFNWIDDDVILADSAIYTQPADSLGGYYTIATILDSVYIPHSGTRIPVNLTLFYNYSKTTQGRFYVGFYTESRKFGEDAFGYYNKTRESIYDEFTRNYDTLTTNYDGKGNTKTIHVGTKHLWQMNPRFNFGAGVLFSTSTVFDSMTYNTATKSVEVYDDNDGQTIDADDYIETVWSSETWMTKTTGSFMAFTFPVGMEFFVVDNALCLRVGATHTLEFPDYTTVHQMIQYDPERTRTEYGDGTVTETLQDPGSSGGYEETQNETESNTNYVFGLGWRVNKNLQIDLMGFTKLVDMAAWKFSAILRL